MENNLLPITKKVFEDSHYVVADGSSVRCDFIAFRGELNPYKSSDIIDGVVMGYNLIVPATKDFIDIAVDITSKGWEQVLYQYFHFNKVRDCGIFIYFECSEEIKFLSYDRLEQFFLKTVNIVNKDYILDLDFYTRGSEQQQKRKRPQYLDFARTDIDLTGKDIVTLEASEKEFYDSQKRKILYQKRMRHF